MMVQAVFVNQTWVTCEVPQPLGNLSTLEIFISYSTEPK